MSMPDDDVVALVKRLMIQSAVLKRFVESSPRLRTEFLYGLGYDLTQAIGLIREMSADMVRLIDLVRHQRHSLHTEGLISDKEYSALMAVSGSVKRLEGYDEVIAASKAKDVLITQLQTIVAGCPICHRKLSEICASSKGTA